MCDQYTLNFGNFVFFAIDFYAAASPKRFLYAALSSTSSFTKNDHIKSSKLLSFASSFWFVQTNRTTMIAPLSNCNCYGNYKKNWK